MAHTGATLTLGAVLKVTKGGHRVATLEPSAGYYPSSEPGKGIVGGLIAGTSVSHVAMNSSLTRDVWTAIEPDIEAPNINRYVTIGNEKIPALGGARVQALAAALTLEALAKEYRKHAPTAQFNLIVSPLVMWIWIGASSAPAAA